MKKRIYFVGSHACGKTTLARYTSEKYKLPFINEVARTVLAEKEYQIDSLRINIDLANTYQKEVLFKQIEEEKKYDSFVSDRSLCCLSYAAQHTSVLHDLLLEDSFIEYVEKLRESEVRIFFVRPSLATLKQDGVREQLTWEGVIQIDAMVKFLLKMYNLPYFEINNPNMQERIQLINSVLEVK